MDIEPALQQQLNALRAERDAAVAREAALTAVLQAINRSSGDPVPIFQIILEKACNLCAAAAGSLLSFDGEYVRALATHNFDDQSAQLVAQPRRSSGLHKRLMHGERYIHLLDSQAQSTGIPDELTRAFITQADVRTALWLPLRREDRVLGIVSVHRHDVRRFSEVEISLLESFATQAAIVLENARLVGELRQRGNDLQEALEHQTATAEVLGVINANPGDTGPVFQAILEQAHRLCDTTTGSLTAFDGTYFRALATHGFSEKYSALIRRPFSPDRNLQTLVDGAPFVHDADFQVTEADDVALRASVEETGAGTALAVPLRKDGILLGYISAFRQKMRPFSDKEIGLLQGFAEQAVIAMENARLVGELRDALTEQRAMADVLRVINSSPGDLQPVFEAMIAKAMHLCQAEFGGFLSYDGRLFHILSPVAAPLSGKEPGALPPEGALAPLVAGAPYVHLLDASDTDEYRARQPGRVLLVEEFGARTALLIPFRNGGVLLGALTIYRREVQAFSDKEIGLLESFAAQAVVAMENARLLTDQREALERQQAMTEVLQVINANPGSLAPVFDAVLEKALHLADAKFGTLLTHDGELFHLAASRNLPQAVMEFAAHGLRPEPGTLHYRLAQGESVVHLADIRDDDAYRAGAPTRRVIADLAGARSQLLVSMRNDHALLGVINVFRTEVRPFTPAQIDLVEAFAAQAVIAMENARLLTEQREALERQQAMTEVLEVINANPGNLAPVFDAVLEKALHLAGAKFGILSVNHDNVFHTEAARDIPPPLLEFAAHGVDAEPGTLLNRVVMGETVVHLADSRDDDAYRSGVPSRVAIVDLGGARSQLVVAMRKDNALLGVINVFRTEVRSFTPAQIGLVEAFAAQAVIAMENARLLTEQREALEQQTATAEVLRVINTSPGKLPPVFDAILERAMRLCGAAFGSLYVYDGEHYSSAAQRGVPAAFAEFRERHPPVPSPGGGLARILQTRRPDHVLDVQASDLYRAGNVNTRAMVDLGGVRTSLAVPLLKDAKVLGVISVYRQEVRGFSDKQITLLESFAAQAVIAMENARLINETSDALEQQTATAEVLQTINASPGSLSPVFESVLERAMRLCNAAFGSLYTYDGKDFRTAALRGVSEEFAEFRRKSPPQPKPGTPLARMMETRRTVHTLDLMEDPSYLAGDARGRSLAEIGGARTALAVPLVKDRTLLGFVTIYRQEVRAFTERQIDLLENFAAQAVIAIENARLLDELRQRTDELALRNSEYSERIDHQAATIDVLKAMSNSPADPQPVFDLIVQRAADICNAPNAVLFRYDGELLHWNATAGAEAFASSAAYDALRRQFPMPPSERSSIGRTVLSRQIQHVRDIDADPDLYQALRDVGMKSLVGVPLLRDGVPLGVVGLSAREAGGFSDTQVTLLETFAEQAVIAITSAETFRELQERTAALALRNSEFGERIEQQAATIEVLKTISRSPDDTRPVFDQIVRRANELCNGLRAQLLEFDGTLVHYRGHTFSNDTIDPAVLEAYRSMFPMAPSRGFIACRAILDKEIVHVRDMAALVDLSPAARSVTRDMRSQISIPLLRDDQVVGVISLGARQPGGFTDSQVALLQTFAEQAVIAIGSVANFRALRERTAELAQRQAELRVTFENMGDGVALYDETLHLVAWNRKFQEIFNVPDSLLEQRGTFEEHIRYLAARGDYGTGVDVDGQVRRLIAYAFEHRVYERIRPDGRVVEIRHNPVADGGFVLIFSDITERKRSEAEIRAARDAAEAAYRELKATQANLIQAEKMASLGQLTAGIAHEIKNPLNFVNNFSLLSAELLDELKQAAAPVLEGLDGDTRTGLEEILLTLGSNMQKINEHGRRADGIVRGMLEHSRGGSGDRRSVDLNALVEEALNLAYHGARAQDQSFNITLQRDYADHIAPVALVPQDITRVVLNLASNGFYAARKRQQFDGADFQPTLGVATRDLGDAVEISVRDNGIGIPAEIQDKLFQPFFTTKATGEGTGLGLSISYDIVSQQHGGSITVDSRVGEYSTFTIRLPRR